MLPHLYVRSFPSGAKWDTNLSSFEIISAEYVLSLTS